MSIIDTLGGAVSSVKKKFHYGHHPSIIMWDTGKVQEKKEDEGIFSGIKNLGKQLEDAVTGGGIFSGIKNLGKQLEDVVTGEQSKLYNSFKFDAMISESHESRATVTSFPVSSGFIVSDHIIKHNRSLVLTAAAVNMQNSAFWSASVQGLSVITGAIFNNPILPIVGGIAGGVASAFETEDRIQSTYELFKTFMGTGQKLYISTIVGPYLNCVVTGIRTKQDKDTSSMLAVEITFEELQVIGPDILAKNAKTAMADMYDYSEFAKMAQTIGIGILGGVPLPGLGSIGDAPTKQLANLKGKLAALDSPLSFVKGRLL